jgi:post-segregation antitoxin (ccd killing protein)
LRHNIYLPDELSRAVQVAGISISTVCQEALKEEVRKVEVRKEASSDLERIAARLRDTRDFRDAEIRAEGEVFGSRWARDVATMTDLEDVAHAYAENWINWRPRESNSIWEWLEAENEPDTEFYQEFADVRGVEDWRVAPFTRGAIAGAIEVYNAVEPLI